MAFGKRPIIATVPAANAPRQGALPETRSSEDRHLALRDMMHRILQEATSIAGAIRDSGSIHIFGIADEIDPVAAPIALRDVAEHFTYSDGASILHPFFAYATPDQPDQVDPRAQFDFLELIGWIRDLNVFCQEGFRDEALGVALQAPSLPPKVDRIIARAAFFAAYFENLAITHAFVMGGAGTGRPLPDFAHLKICFDRNMLMASDRMLRPETLMGLLPGPGWSHLGIEIPRFNEAGEQFVHGVYFPSVYALQLIERAGRVPSVNQPAVA